MELTTQLPVLILIVPLLFAFALPLLFRRRPEMVAAAALAAVFLSFILSIVLLLTVLESSPVVYYLGGWEPPFGIELRVDYISIYMLLIITGVSLPVLAYSKKSLETELKPNTVGWYYSLFLFLIFALSGMSVTNDLFNMFVFMEICAIASCAIITVKKDKACLEAGFKYLMLSAMGTGCFLLAVAMIYMITGHLNFDMAREVLTENASLYPNNVMVSLALIIVAFGVKAALFPLHVWLPDAHGAAPSPSSAVLSGLVIKVYAVGMLSFFYRLFPAEVINELPVREIVLWLSTAGVLYGSVVAMRQRDFKRMLAFSSIAQIGYVFMGIGLNNERALVGGMVHILNHGIMKAMLFMVAGIIIYSTGKRNLDDFAGIGGKLPFTMVAFIIGGASMIGIPPTGGFIGKWCLVQGAIEAGGWFFVVVILISSFMNAVYYLPVAIIAFWGREKEPLVVKPVPRVMHVSVGILLAAVLFFGVFPGPVTNMLDVAAAVLMN